MNSFLRIWITFEGVSGLAIVNHLKFSVLRLRSAGNQLVFPPTGTKGKELKSDEAMTF